jgi:hypothetical protein
MAEADHAFHLAQHLSSSGVEVHVLTTQQAALRAINGSCTVHAIMRDWSWSDLPRFAGCIRRCAPDAILLLYVGDVYNHQLMVTFAPTIAKAVHPHAIFVTQFETPFGTWPRYCSKLSRAIRKAVMLWAGSTGVDYEFGTLVRDSDRIVVMSETHLVRLKEVQSDVADKSSLIPTAPILRVAPEANGTSRSTIFSSFTLDICIAARGSRRC